MIFFDINRAQTLKPYNIFRTFPVTARQNPEVLFPKSPKVLNTAVGYGGMKTVTGNLRHYDFSCLFGLNMGETRGDTAGVPVTRTLGGISHGCAVPFPILLAGGALARLLKTEELRLYRAYFVSAQPLT